MRHTISAVGACRRLTSFPNAQSPECIYTFEAFSLEPGDFQRGNLGVARWLVFGTLTACFTLTALDTTVPREITFGFRTSTNMTGTQGVKVEVGISKAAAAIEASNMSKLT